jgi:GNAT superfamily N-acetyltransferase
MLDELSPFERSVLAFLAPLRWDYPEFQTWYLTKVIPGKRIGERRVFVKFNENTMIAVGIAKATSDEKKICTLYVSPDYRAQGVGRDLIVRMLQWLKTPTPVIAIKQTHLEPFLPIIEQYDWQLSSVHCRADQPRWQECIYNQRRTD